jgi:hypothetical protein
MLNNMKNPVKIPLNWGTAVAVCLLMVASARATVTNASWTFPASTTPAPSQPISADLSIYSVNDVLGWTLADNRLAVAFVAHAGLTTALDFSYNGNHPAYLNGSILTLTSTISGLPSGDWLADIQLSYDTRWNKTANTVTETWAYSINGAAYINFDTVAVTGNVWQTEVIPLSGLTLNNGDTLILRDTITGAAGSNGNLDFDDFKMTSEIVPEPSSLALVLLSVGSAGLWFRLRVKSHPRNSRPAPSRARWQASRS